MSVATPRVSARLRSKKTAGEGAEKPQEDVAKHDVDSGDTESDSEDEEASEYEKTRAANIRANMQRLITVVSPSILGPSESQTSTRTSSPHGASRPKKRAARGPVVVRKSRRIAGHIADAASAAAHDQAQEAIIEEERVRPARLPDGSLDIEKSAQWDSLFSAMQETGERRNDTDTASKRHLALAEDLAKFRLAQAGPVKAVPERVYSLALHPNTDAVVAIAGDKQGNVGFVRFQGKEAVVTKFRAHAKPVSGFAYSPGDASLLSTSYDGTVRQLDIQGQRFLPMYSCSDTDVSYHGIERDDDSSCYLLARDDGCVEAFDVRAGAKTLWIRELHDKKINSVSVHNFQLATASLDRTVKLFDLRKLSGASAPKKGKPTMVWEHGLSVNDAVFDKMSGTLQSSCQDNLLRVWDAKDISSASASRRIRHDCRTGRWLTKFQASFVPHTWGGDFPCFVIGSMSQPRQITFYAADTGRALVHLRDEDVNSVNSVHCFHPTLTKFCSANSSGRIHLWTQ